MNHQCDWRHSAKGDPLWLSDPDEGYVKATLVSVQGDKVIVEATADGKRYTVDAAPALGKSGFRRQSSEGRGGVRRRREEAASSRRLLPRSQVREEERSPHGLENMDNLDILNEATILANIEHRFRLDYIYTRTGPILIALNPFKWLPIYGEEMVRQYHAKPYGSLPPHCYQEAEDAYQQLQRSGGQNQSVVICGDSGAGKTETTKLMLQYISIVARDDGSGKDPAPAAGAGPAPETTTTAATAVATTIGEKLVQSNPLMEAFGNAKTLRNYNSSRFGKFTLLNFRRPPKHHHHHQPRNDGGGGGGFPISGGRVSNFLLEKSRVVRQQGGERNYHVFYQLLAGSSEELRARLHLPPRADGEGGGWEARGSFHYLSQSGCTRVEGIDDAQDFGTTRSAMNAVGIARAEQDDLFQLVAGVLHLGNVDFAASADGEASSVAAGAGEEALRLASELLGLDAGALGEALTSRVRILPGEEKTVRSPQTAAQSRDSRDALAKAVYNKLFDHLVARINAAFDRDPSPAAPFIGILDIFGFEDMAVNSFEQLLINFTNEKLQLLFNEATFKMEEEEYMREQIEWDRTDFPDNQPCVDLIEKKPMALLPILDSECTRGGAASDAALVATYNRSFKDHAHYSVCGPSTPWRKRANGGGTEMASGGNGNNASSDRSSVGSGSYFTNENDFVVVHYAGPVIYTSTDFVDKNRDALFDHVNSLLATGSSNALITTLFLSRDDTSSALRAANVTVAQRFTAQLNSLTQTLQSCQVRFVRCIKSNHELQPQVIDKPAVLKQLICSGVMAALEVRRAGFPTRVGYADFVRDFRVFAVGFPTGEHDRGRHEQRLKENRTASQLQAATAAPSAGKRAKGDDDGDEEGDDQEADTAATTAAATTATTAALAEARALTARMMTHPAVLEAITARQYRLGVSKLFLQADALLVLQSVKNRLLLPQVTRLQRWWIRLSESALAHKLKRAANGLQEAQARAEMAGVHQVGTVRQALQDCAAAVRYARGLGSLHPDVFRPAVNKACAKVAALEALLLRTLAVKEREAQQRAELLALLDSGRAHLAHVQQGLRGITIPAAAALRKLADRASQGLSAQSAELLRPGPGKGPGRRQGEEEEEDREDQEAGLRLRRRKVEEVLSLIKEAEAGYQKLSVQQRELDEARAGARERLAAVKATVRQAGKAAEAAGVQGAVVVQQQQAAAKERVEAAEAALGGTDACAFGHAVERARYAAAELAHAVEAEKRRKEDQDLRAEGQACLDEAARRVQELKADAEAAGVKQALAAGVKALESEASAAAALAAGADPHAFVAACKRVLQEGVAALEGSLRAEKLAKQQNDEQRQSELDRLALRLAALHDVQAAIQTQFELASEEELCRAVAACVQAIGDAKARLAKSAVVASLRDTVDQVLLQAAATERLYGEVRQRHELRAKELARAKEQRDVLQRRLRTLLAAHGLGEEGAAVGPASTVLGSLVEGTLGAAQEALAALERSLRQWTGSPEDALRNGSHALSEALDQLEADVASQLRRLEVVAKGREDEMARLAVARERFQEFVAGEIYAAENQEEGEEADGEEEGTVPTAAAAAEAEATARPKPTFKPALQLKDKASVREAVLSTQAALRRAEEQLKREVTLAWLEREDASQHEERRAVGEAVAKVDAAQLFLAEEKRRHGAWLQHCRANQASAEAAAAKLRELEALVEDGQLAQLRSVQAVLEECACAHDAAAKLLAQSSRQQHQQEQEQEGAAAAAVDDATAKDKDVLALKARRAIAVFADKVKQAEATVLSCRAQREAEEKERADIHARFEAVLLRYQGAVGMIEAGGAIMKRLTHRFVDTATVAVNATTRLLRRGAAGEEALAQLAASATEAGAQVDLLETEAQAIKSKVDRATRLKVTEGKKVAALSETLALCADTAEHHGVQAVAAVARPLAQARERLAAVRLKLESDLLEAWMEGTAALAAQVEEAGKLVAEAEEAVDREAQRKERNEKELAILRRTVAALGDRHAASKRAAEEAGVAQVAAVAQAAEAAGLELATVRQALEAAAEGSSSATVGAGAMPVASLALLVDGATQRVAQEEEAMATEARRLRGREVELQQAARDLASMLDRMGKLDLVMTTAATTATAAGDGADVKEEDEEQERKPLQEPSEDGSSASTSTSTSKAAALFLASAASHVRDAVQDAKAALWKIRRVLKEGGSSWTPTAGAAVPSTEAAMELVRAAEEAVHRQVSLVHEATQKRSGARQRLRFLDRKFADLQEEVALLCARSDHLRTQLEADWGEGQCWWGAQSGASQAEGSVGSAAAMMAMQPIATVQLLAEAVAAAQAAMARAKQRVEEAPLASGPPGSRGPEDTHGPAAHALDEALVRIDHAAGLVEAEKARAQRDEQERLVAVRNVELQGDRLARLRVVAEARGVEGLPTVAEGLEAAERALGVVGQLLAAGGGTGVASPAFEVALRRVQEAEEVVQWEVQRKVRRERQCASAREDLARLRLKLEALRHVVKEFGYLGGVAAVADGVRDVERAIERADLAVASPDVAVATVQREVRGVGQRIEAAERAIRRERIHHEERLRFAQQREEEARLQAAREAEEARRNGEMEKLKRSQLDVELEKLMFRLSMHRPTLDSIQANMARAEEAVKSARSRLLEGGIAEAEAAAESAYTLAQSFEQTVSSLRGGAQESGGASELEPSTGSALGISGEGSQEDEAEMRDLMPSSWTAPPQPFPPALTASAAAAAAAAATTAAATPAPAAPQVTPAAAAGFQDYMDRTTTTLETVARSVEALTQSMAALQTSVRKQWQAIDAQAEILASPDKLLTTPTRGASSSLSLSSRPPSAFGLGLDAEAGRRTPPTVAKDKSADDINRSVDGGKATSAAPGEEEAVEATEKEGASASDAAIGGSGSGSGSGRKAGRRRRQGAKGDNEQLRRRLRSKGGDDTLYERLMTLVTSNGVTLQDCIAFGTGDDATLEFMAGDRESYRLFAPVFDAVIEGAQPRYKGRPADHRQRIVLEPDRLLPEVAAEEAAAQRGEPGYRMDHVRLARVMVSRNLEGRNYTPTMTREQLQEVEATVVAALRGLRGRLQGTYTPLRDVLRDPGLQKELDRANLVAMAALTENADRLTAWPEGRGVFLTDDRSLCVIVNMEDHLSILTTFTRRGKNKAAVPAAMVHRAFDLACEVVAALSGALRFDFDEQLGYTTPSAGKLGTALSCSLVLMPAPTPAPEEVQRIEGEFCVELGGLEAAAAPPSPSQPEEGASPAAAAGGSRTCIVGSHGSLVCTEIDSITSVLAAARSLLSTTSS